MDNTSKVIDDLVVKLLHLNKEIYHNEGKAPKLAVYMTPTFKRTLLHRITLNPKLGFRDCALVYEQEIAGYPVHEVTETECSTHPDYEIVRIY